MIGNVEDAVGHRDVEERDHRHPDDIEHGDHDADAFGAEPVEPAEREFALLLAGEAARAGQKAAPMLLDDLESAIGPAVALLLVGLESVGQQAMAVAPVGVMRVPAELEHGEAEIGVFADGVARPAAGGFHAPRGGSGTWCRAR